MNRLIPVDESHAANSEILRYLQAHALKRSKWAPDFHAVPYEMHARDDLEEYFFRLGQNLPEYCEGLSYGFPILVYPKEGIIFALATDTNSMAIRLPEDARRTALSSGAVEVIYYRTVGIPQSSLSTSELGSDWILVNALGPVGERLIEQWMQEAYGYAGELASGAKA